MATGTVQRIHIVGRVGKNPPKRVLLDTGRYEVRFDVASHFFGILNGIPTEKVDWWKVICYDRHGDFAEKYLKTGSLVYVEGHLSRVYQDVEIVCRDLQVFGPCLICQGIPIHCSTCQCGDRMRKMIGEPSAPYTESVRS